MLALVVTNPFGGHEKGDQITDPDQIKEILEGEHAHHVVRVELADKE